MLQEEEAKVKQRHARYRLLLSLTINGLTPLILYFLLRRFVGNDTTALAIACAIPAARTIVVWFSRHRADWIGVLATLSFAVALLVSYISGGSVLALELRGAALTGTIGLLCLLSLVVGRPALSVLIKVFALNMAKEAHISQQRLTTLTTVVGVALVGKTVADIVLALTFSTTTFLAVSHVVNWVILGSGLAFVWLTRQSGQMKGN